MKKAYLFATCLTLACTMSVSGEALARKHDNDQIEQHRKRKAKNIIFMVPDGMGLADVTAARIAINGPNGHGLHFESLPVIGYQRTHSADSTVTDSAAAASAWAAGEKFNNGEISCHAIEAVCLESPATILEIAKAMGKATGLVATSTITHATPASFGAHVNSRKCETEIGRQYIEDTQVDVLLGGGIGPNSTSSSANCAQYPGQDKDAIIAAAQAANYRYVTTADELQAAVSGDDKGKILGLFNAEGLTPEYLRTPQVSEPRLPEMTATALDILEEDKDGFFLMVEGSQIDWANHANDYPYQLGEMRAFDESVRMVREWIAARPGRGENTLLIVVADHDTGGFAVNGPYGTLSNAGDSIQAGWSTDEHTAGDTIIWSQGPGSHLLGRAVDNTDLYHVMESVLR
ncbi:alkaline phosphatase [Thiovibrio sp. JS02]